MSKEKIQNKIVPIFTDTVESNVKYDVFSLLLKERIIFLSGPIEEQNTSLIIAQMMTLKVNSSKPIFLYINSPGGSVYDTFPIIDLMSTCTVHTVALGLAASAGALILACGAKRYAFANSRIMIHQPLGGARGPATDVEIQAKELLTIKKVINRILSEKTGQTVATIMNMTERDKYLSAKEAKEIGLIDEVIGTNSYFEEIT